MAHCSSNHHHHTVDNKSVNLLLFSFAINILLSLVEIIGGILSSSVSLIGDALHNTSDAFSILIAVIAFKIGRKKASQKYTYGFKRAEVIGGFVNLILLFVFGCYLFVEGISRIINPQKIDGALIIWISVLALIIDALTAKISHHDAHHNSNMKMVFVHNLADAFGSVGVIISGIFVLLFDIFYVDGIIALVIAAYMIFQALVSFPKITDILMNAAPDDFDLKVIENALRKIKNVDNVHHIHLWRINEYDISFECHLKTKDPQVLTQVQMLLKEQFNIRHSTIQIDIDDCQQECDL